MAQVSYAGIDFGECETIAVPDAAGERPQRRGQPVHQGADQGQHDPQPVLGWPQASRCSSAPPGPGGEFPGPPPTTVGVGPGDRLGVTLSKPGEILRQHRQRLTYRVGADLVIDSPGVFADGTPVPCDPTNGPHVLDATVTPIIGDRTAVLVFEVETTICNCDKYILSNRYEQSVDIDAYGYTTRTTRGLVIARADFHQQRARHHRGLVPEVISWRRRRPRSRGCRCK